MDNTKIGGLICRLRKEKQLTQLQLAELLHISDKTVSKWERGFGCPDVSLLAELSRVFEVDLEKLLAGELAANEVLGGNLKKLLFFVCPHCGNIVTALTDTGIVCCGKKLKPLQAQKAAADERLSVEIIENEYYITAQHPMERAHHISFTALLTADSLLLRKHYPEWELQTRFPRLGHGQLLWYCNLHGLFYQNL